MATASAATEKTETKPTTKAVARKSASTAKPKATTAAKTAAKPTAKTAAKSAKPASKTAKATPKAATSARASKARAKTAAATSRKSRDSSKTGKEHDDHAERAWKLAKRIGTAMFVTWDGERQRSRPLAATVEKDEGAIYFLTDIAGEKDDQIAEYPYVSVNFVDNSKVRYVVFSGKATVSNDRERIKELWSPFAKAWWDSPEDPSIRVIRMTPEDAELWDSPGRLATTVSMLAAAVTGRSPKVGENAKIVL